MEELERKEFNPDTDPAWYVIGCITGRDNKVFESLNAKKEKGDWGDLLLDVVQPIEKEITTKQLKSGAIKTTEKIHLLFQGYVFVQCVMTNELWFEIRNTPGVSGIIGSHGKGSKPTPMTKEEVNRVLRLAGREVPITDEIDFKEGDKVIMSEGPFAGKEGTVTKMDLNKKLVTVEMNLFKKEINMELSIFAVKKA